jgi:hypothetical protein
VLAHLSRGNLHQSRGVRKEKNAKKKKRQAAGWDEKYLAAQGQLFFSFLPLTFWLYSPVKKTHFKENTR